MRYCFKYVVKGIKNNVHKFDAADVHDANRKVEEFIEEIKTVACDSAVRVVGQLYSVDGDCVQEVGGLWTR